MLSTPEMVATWLWALWAVSWFAAAFWSDRTAKRPGLGRESLYRILTFAGFVMLFFFYSPRHSGPLQLWDLGTGAKWALVGIVTIGFAFCWWARLHLGRLWSGWVTKKADHRIVDTGPYAIVRHPIYTGVLLAAFATAGIKGTVIALLGALAMTLGFWTKARLEERFLSEELGAEAYAGYRRRTPMLLPFGPKSA